MAGIKVYYPHSGTDYLLPFTDTQDTGWKNMSGNLIDTAALISEGSSGYNIPSPGNYIFTFHNNYGLVERLGSATWVDSENGIIFEHGGTVGGTVVNTLSIFDTTTHTWSTGTAGGGARKEHSTVVYGRKAYVYGGIDDDGNYLNSLYSYNLDTGIWTSLGTGGTARAGATIEIIDGNIYIVGGYDNDGGITTVDIYDTDTGTYTTGAELSDPDEGGSPEPEVIDPGGDCYTIDAGGYTNATIKESTSELWLWVPPDGDTSSHWVVVDLDTGEARYFYGSGSPAGYNIGRWCWDGDEIYNHYSSGGTDYLSKFDTSDEGNTWQNVGSLPCSSPCNRWQVNYEGYRYDIAGGTKTNISTGSSSEWVGPPGIEDTGYMVIGAKDGYIYVADAEEWNPSPGVTQIRLILWLHNLDEGTWAKITFDSPWDDYDNWADRAYHIGAADSDYLYIASGSKALTGGDYSEENCVKLFRIRMVSGEAATAYVLATESKIYRINPSTRKTQSYDTSTDTWTTVSTADSDLPRNGLITMGTAGVPIIMGGKDSGGENNTNAYVLNPYTGAVEAASASLLSPHVGGSSAFVGTSLYIWGGTGSGYQDTLEVYDTSSGTIETYDLSYYNCDSFWEDMIACDTSNVRWTDGWETCRETAWGNYPTLDVTSSDIEDKKNPNLRGDVTVDGSPDNQNIHLISSINIALVSCPYNHQKSRLVVGGIWDDSEGRVIIPQRFGLVPMGTNSSTTTFKIKNDSGSSLSNLRAYIFNRPRVRNVSGTPFKSIRHMKPYDPAGFDTIGSVGITFTNLVSGSPNTIDMLVDGNYVDVYDSTDDSLITNSKELKCDGSTEYYFGHGSSYAGVGFILNSSLTASDTATLYVNPGGSIYRFKLSSGSDWSRGGERVSLGTLADQATVNLDIQASPRFGLDKTLNPLEALLHVSDGTYSTSIVLSTHVVDGSETPLIIRTTVFPAAVVNKMSEFGVSFAT